MPTQNILNYIQFLISYILFSVKEATERNTEILKVKMHILYFLIIIITKMDSRDSPCLEKSSEQLMVKYIYIVYIVSYSADPNPFSGLLYSILFLSCLQCWYCFCNVLQCPYNSPIKCLAQFQYTRENNIDDKLDHIGHHQR